jgi:hypothetical protein
MRDTGQREGESAMRFRQVADRAIERLADYARRAANSLVEDQSRRVAIIIQRLLAGLQGSAKAFEEEGNDSVARVINAASEEVAEFFGKLPYRQLDEMLADLREFAHRQPFLCVLSGLGIGLLVGYALVPSRSRQAK